MGSRGGVAAPRFRPAGQGEAAAGVFAAAGYQAERSFACPQAETSNRTDDALPEVDCPDVP